MFPTTKLSKLFISQLKLIFNKLAKWIANNPVVCIIGTIIFILLLATGFREFKYEDDPEYLFSHLHGPAVREKKIVEEYFSSNITMDFNRATSSSSSRYAKFIIVSKDGGSVTRSEIWQHVEEFHEKMTKISIENKYRTFNFYDVISTCLGVCNPLDVGALGNLFKAVERGEDVIDYLSLFSGLPFPLTFGGLKLDDEEYTVESAEAVILYYQFKNEAELSTLV